jgi:hypothetical protein
MTQHASTSAVSVVKTMAPFPAMLHVLGPLAPEVTPTHAEPTSPPEGDTPEVSLPFNLPLHSQLQYTDFSSLIHHRPRLHSNTPEDIEIYERVIHPYNSSAFSSLLDKYQLLDSYPLLSHNLDYGFPLGDLPPLLDSVIIKNYSSVEDNINLVQKYINTELGADRMLGPFSHLALERILRGPFYCSPFLVSSNDQGLFLPPKLQVCRNLSKGDSKLNIRSVNSFISKSNFPTRFDMAAQVADAVSFIFIFPHHFLSLYLWVLVFVPSRVLPTFFYGFSPYTLSILSCWHLPHC